MLVIVIMITVIIISFVIDWLLFINRLSRPLRSRQKDGGSGRVKRWVNEEVGDVIESHVIALLRPSMFVKGSFMREWGGWVTRWVMSVVTS